MGEPNLAPQVLAGRYLLYDVIAGGGMATVHLARLVGSVGFARTVDIKRLHTHFANQADFRAMFVDEARLAARIVHPTVVQTFDVVEDGDELFIVMEYIHGLPLSRLMATAAKVGGVPVPVAASVMAGVLQGLHAAHEATDENGVPLQIVHRDVSPQNVLVGMDGVARLIDFGVAKAVSQIHTTREGQLKGKLAYMAPEQIRHGKVDRQTDVFSAAVVLWQLLTGRKLFKSSNEGELIYQLLEAPIPPPSELRADVSKKLDAVVLRGLSRDREQRYKTAQQMLLDLESEAPMVTQRAVAEWASSVSEEDLSARTNLISRVSRTSLPDDVMEAALTLSDAAVTLPRELASAPEIETSAVVEKPTVALSAPRLDAPPAVVENAPPRRRWALIAVPAFVVLVVAALAFRSDPPAPALEAASTDLPRVALEAKRRAAAAAAVAEASVPPPVPLSALPTVEPAEKPKPRVIFVPKPAKPAPANPGNAHLYKRE